MAFQALLHYTHDSGDPLRKAIAFSANLFFQIIPRKSQYVNGPFTLLHGCKNFILYSEPSEQHPNTYNNFHEQDRNAQAPECELRIAYGGGEDSRWQLLLLFPWRTTTQLLLLYIADLYLATQECIITVILLQTCMATSPTPFLHAMP